SRRPASGGHSASRSSPCGRVAGRWPARPATIADRKDVQLIHARYEDNLAAFLAGQLDAFVGANDEHVPLLRQGVAAWNAGRRENPDIRPDLRGAALSEESLSAAKLSAADASRRPGGARRTAKGGASAA